MSRQEMENAIDRVVEVVSGDARVMGLSPTDTQASGLRVLLFREVADWTEGMWTPENTPARIATEPRYECSLGSGMKLCQYQCNTEGSLFYYQHGSSPVPTHIVEHCPVCGSKGVALTGREYEPVDERQPLWGPVARTVIGLDETESEDIALEVEVTFGTPEGEPTDQGFWESALDHFVSYDNLNASVQGGDYWHSREGHRLTGTTYLFDFELTELGDRVALGGDAIRFEARELANGDYLTADGLAFERAVVSQVKFTMEFKDADAARPVVSYIQEVYGGIPDWYS